MAKLNRSSDGPSYYIGWYGDCETECENIKLQKFGDEEVTDAQQTVINEFADAVYVIYEFAHEQIRI